MQLTGHAGGVNSVAAVELDGRRVVISGGSDGAVRVGSRVRLQEIDRS